MWSFRIYNDQSIIQSELTILNGKKGTTTDFNNIKKFYFLHDS